MHSKGNKKKSETIYLSGWDVTEIQNVRLEELKWKRLTDSERNVIRVHRTLHIALLARIPFKLRVRGWEVHDWSLKRSRDLNVIIFYFI